MFRRFFRRRQTNDGDTIKLVSPESAAVRALCLGTIVSRSHIFEAGIRATRENSPAMVDTMVKEMGGPCEKLKDWIRAEGLWRSLSAKEQAIMTKPLGQWTDQEYINTQWRTEALGAIEWVIGIQPVILPYDQLSDPAVLARGLGLMGQTRQFVAKTRLRSQREIARARSIAELWLWRARTTQIQNQGVKPPAQLTFAQIIAVTAKQCEQDGYFTPIQDDFPAFGKPYSALTSDELSMCGSIASERLYALNWLCGHSRDWDNVATHT